MSDISSQDSSSQEQKAVKVVGRNEPCPCGSGVKYKRCHGVEAPPKLTERKMPEMPSGFPGMGGAGAPGAMPGGFDPSQLDPAMLMQMSQMLQRLPKSQMQKLQHVMTRAMAGKDVTREAQELERSLPPEFLEMMKGFAGPAMAAMGGGAGMPDMGAIPGAMPVESEPVSVEAAPVNMSAEEARAIVEKAVREGTVTAEQAAGLLSGDGAPGGAPSEPAKKQSFWSRFTGKK